MAADRGAIPEAVKLEVRQRCGFGCVLCGGPVYQYDHVEGIANTGHDPAHITLLCATHHNDKTGGRLPVAQVRRANEYPFNAERSFGSSHPLYFDGDEFVLQLGNLIMKIPEDAMLKSCGIIVDGAVALGATVVRNHLRVDLDVRDIDNKRLLRISDGELLVAPDNWDVTYEGRRLRIREGHRRIVLDATVDAPKRLYVRAADFYFNNVHIQLGLPAVARGAYLEPHFFMANLTFESGALVAGDIPRKGFVWAFPIDVDPRSFGAPPIHDESPLSTRIRRKHHRLCLPAATDGVIDTAQRRNALSIEPIRAFGHAWTAAVPASLTR